MYSGFNLHINEDAAIFSEYGFETLKENGKRHLEDQRSKFQKEITEYVMQEEINGSEIQNSWFPQIEADVFISHSRQDEELACALAGWLHKHFELRCFIDSNVWGYAGELREKLNDKVSNKREDGEGGYLLDHQSCNEVSQHVDTMLTIALYQTIDRVETVFLLNTENAVQTVHSGRQMDKTYSPWIYSEVICTQLVRKKPLLVYREYETGSLEHALYESMKFAMHISISYTFSLTHLISIDGGDLSRWQEEYEQEKQEYDYPLDALYNFKRPKEVERTKELFSKLDSDSIGILKQAYSSDGTNGEIWHDMKDEACQYSCCCGECVCERKRKRCNG